MSENDRVSCKIVSGEIGPEEVLTFGISGKALVHVLVAPKERVSSLTEIRRLPDAVVKDGPDAGREVFRLHTHVMGGRMP